KSDRHRWFFYPAMTRDEALLIKQWDSIGRLARTSGAEADSGDDNEPCTFSFHTAFEDPATPPDAPDRWSIEVRCMVLYD
ncbi:MAG: CmcJ/NvfI family oxidoreductase, partial [Hyphomicrobiales bacterium]